MISTGVLKLERVQVICPACGQQVEAVAKDGRVKGYCAAARQSVDFLIETELERKKWWLDPEYRAKLSSAMKKRWQDPEYRAKQIATHIGRHPTAETKAVSFYLTITSYSFNLLSASRTDNLDSLQLQHSFANHLGHQAGHSPLGAIPSFIPGHMTLDKVPSLVPTFCHNAIHFYTGRRDATCRLSVRAPLTGADGGKFKLLGRKS